MTIRSTTSKAAIRNAVEAYQKRCFAALVRTLSYCGEQVVNKARGNNARTYTDQTGNLRSSVGYILAFDGKVISKSSFAAVRNGSEGSKEGENLAKLLADKHNKGFALIVVAGMEYSVYVQDKGYDVLTSGELLAEQIVPRMLKQLNF